MSIVQAVNAREIRGSFIVRGVDLSSETPTYRTKVHIRWLNPAQKYDEMVEEAVSRRAPHNFSTQTPFRGEFIGFADISRLPSL